MLGCLLGFNVARSFINYVFKEKVTPVPGSIVYCNLSAAGGLAQHSGIYIGNNEIIELNGDGIIRNVNPEQFLERNHGLNLALDIYVSCDEYNLPVGNMDTVERAESILGKNRNYNIIFDNCHQFTAGCLTGNFDNADNFLWMLKSTAKNKIDATRWLIWETIDGDY